MARLGVLGGMFDPVHNGHIQAACYALERLSLDGIKMTPCSIPNHRDPAIASAQHRLGMLELATTEYPAITIDSCEIDRAGISYTVDTLLSIRQSVEVDQLVLILGLDSFNGIIQWHDWKQILKLCHLLVLSRPGMMVQDAVATGTQLAAREVNSVGELFARSEGNILLAQDFHQDISSTAVRAQLQSQEDNSTCVDHKVLQYIAENNLYS
ncbi:MAG TPA: nicotinic acid mononucleotide adenylyltransferase [Gammaproteobacteria bacterium]|nr:nicotinate-nucleotide adenylyltransferase [Gammaproteobacteria bacterium]MDP6732747.1 nicotinate-nucleotide adenylyltransferase [Gammaproteobacteria bacterium]HAJ74861.1 nicotinic acid mononucleotide adenylyltransferase [Gammaproteobacteria bacterium]